MKIDYEKKPPLIELPNEHFVRSWHYVDGAPYMKFLPDGKIKFIPKVGKPYIVETAFSKLGTRVANIQEEEV